MKILCWNTNESVWDHWQQILASDIQPIRTNSFEETESRLNEGEFGYCFVYLGDTEFARMVEDTVILRERFPSIKLVAFPNRRSQSAALRMLSMGVNGQCAPYIGKEQIQLVLSVVEAGEIWGGKDFIQQLIEQNAQGYQSSSYAGDSLESLSDRERSVALFVAQGFSNKRIATELDVTERTIKAHLTAIFKKLEVRDRLSLALMIQKEVVE